MSDKLTREQIERFKAHAGGANTRGLRTGMDFWESVRVLCDMALASLPRTGEEGETPEEAAALDDIKGLVQFAYEHGFHELGYDPIATVADRIERLEREKREESAIVDSVWKALGIESYEQAKPYAIDEHVANLQSALAAAKRGLERYEKLRRLNVPQFQELFKAAFSERFDDLVDRLPTAEPGERQ